MASYVFVWENNTPGHSRVSGHNWVGHASIHIGDYFWTEEYSRNGNYVSFWPDKLGAQFSVRGILTEKARPGTVCKTIMEDVAAEGYLPDHIIKLPSSEEAENRMKGEWLAVVCSNNGKPEYKALRQNCSTICSRVLHAGGFYAEKWAINNNVVWTPSDVERLASDIRGGQGVKWTDFLAMMKRETGQEDPFDGVTMARSGCYCTTGAPVEYQRGERFTGGDGEFKGPTGNAAYRPAAA